MSEDVGGTVASKLEEIGPSVSVALEIGMDAYFDVVRGLTDNFAARKGLKCVYITSSVPSSTMLSALKMLEVDTKNIYFVDCISHLIAGNIGPSENTIYIDNPTMLESIILKVDFLSRKLREGSMLVVLDSINSLAIHNDIKILSEFMQILLSSLKSKGAYPVIISVAGQAKSELKEVIALVCDQVVPVQLIPVPGKL
ncbi:MAG: hypothetical protein ABSB83_01835 [Methanomassiliicoccales archaeon]